MNLEIIQEGELEAKLSALSIQPTFFKEIMAKQLQYPKFIKLREQVSKGKAKGFTIHEDRIDSLKEKLLNKAHNSRYSVLPGGKKMYQDLKCMFCWLVMKKNIAKFVAKCICNTPEFSTPYTNPKSWRTKGNSGVT